MLLIQLLHQRLHHFIPMLTKVLIQRIGRTFGQHHNLNAPVARALRIFRVQQHLVRHCAHLHHFIFRHSGLFQPPTSRKRAIARKVPVVVDIVFVGHRIGMPGNNNFVIERVENWRELHQQPFKERHNLRAAAFEHIASLISTRNPCGTISISRFASICASRAMVLILVASSPSSVADFFFSSTVFSLTSRAFFSVSSGTATVAGFGG